MISDTEKKVKQAWGHAETAEAEAYVFNDIYNLQIN